LFAVAFEDATNGKRATSQRHVDDYHGGEGSFTGGSAYICTRRQPGTTSCTAPTARIPPARPDSSDDALPENFPASVVRAAQTRLDAAPIDERGESRGTVSRTSAAAFCFVASAVLDILDTRTHLVPSLLSAEGTGDCGKWLRAGEEWRAISTDALEFDPAR
jgi:hypothetical protein